MSSIDCGAEEVAGPTVGAGAGAVNPIVVGAVGPGGGAVNPIGGAIGAAGAGWAALLLAYQQRQATRQMAPSKPNWQVLDMATSGDRSDDDPRQRLYRREIPLSKTDQTASVTPHHVIDSSYFLSPA
jgi:hypothetical protein